MKVYDTCMFTENFMTCLRGNKKQARNSYSTTNKKFHSFTVLEHRCLWEKKLPFNPQKTTDICVIHQYCGGVGLLFSSQFFPALSYRWREVCHALLSVYDWFGGWKYWICMYSVTLHMPRLLIEHIHITTSPANWTGHNSIFS